jgi:hypothetical protein
MKKFLYTALCTAMIGTAVMAQDKEPAKEKANFDKKFRFGLRVAGQPAWLSSTDNNNKPKGAKFGTGFGLNMEFRLSDIVAFSTGIGGDFEGGKYSFRNDTANNYQVVAWTNSAGEYIEANDNNILNNATTAYILKERSIKTTHVTVPLLLKLSTNEYGGCKYFGMFGGELGVRVKTIATDTYYNSWKMQNGVLSPTTAAYAQSGEGETKVSGIKISKEASGAPLRFGMNAGLGMEYRLGGSTSFFFSVNYFRSFTNLMRKESKALVYNVDSNSGSTIYSKVKQNYIQSAIRINIGILF